MQFAIVLILTFLFVLFITKTKMLKKFTSLFYIISLALGIVTTYMSFSEQPIIDGITPFVTIMKQGLIAMALFVIVMYAGAFKANKITIPLMQYRAELSILAVIFMLNHVIYYGYVLIKIFPTWANLPKMALFINIMTSLLSIWAWAICIPLFITSFRLVRQKMNAKAWKNLQRYAYLFYGVVYVHLIFAILSRPSWTDYTLDIIVYSIVFFVYGILRMNKAMRKAEGNKRNMLGVGIAACILFLVASCALPLYGKSLTEVKEVKLVEKQAIETAEAGVEEANYYKDGKYQASAKGFRGNIVLEVELKNDKITNINIVKESEDKAYFNSAKKIIPMIIAANTTDVDTISGATISSKAILQGVNNALDKAVNNE